MSDVTTRFVDTGRNLIVSPERPLRPSCQRFPISGSTGPKARAILAEVGEYDDLWDIYAAAV